jgi:[acyl-carrier-protein] S-malonyltransferase
MVAVQAQPSGLAARRAAAMYSATTQACGLAAIRGLTRETLDAITRAHGAYVAIVNGRDQIVVGGTREALAAVIHDAQLLGAQRTTMLPVADAAHTPLLADASDRFRQALAKTHLAAEIPPSVRLLIGIDGATLFHVRAGADKWRAKSNRWWTWLPAWSRAAPPTSPRLFNQGRQRSRAHDARPDAGKRRAQPVGI